MPSERHELVYEGRHARVVAMDSITHANEDNGPGDVLIGASFLGVLTAQWAARWRPRSILAHDCGVGLYGGGISGLWYLDALRIPACVAGHETARVGDGDSVFSSGAVSHLNHWAQVVGCRPGMSISEAAKRLADWDGELPADDEPRDNREVVLSTPEGDVVAVGSIRFANEHDCGRNVVCVGSHGGVTAGRYAVEVRPRGFVSSDGGIGRDAAGVAGLEMLDDLGIPAAAVSVQSALIGDGLSTYHDGIVSVANSAAEAVGVQPGATARAAASAMLIGRSPS